MVPDVSVIVPLYNAEQFVAECIDSVLSQTHRNFELICVDDGSIDDTLSIVKARAECDCRIVLINQANAGPGAARNAGLSRARGRYVYCLDADDYLKQTMLAQCVHALDKTNADMALVAFNTYNQIVREEFPAEWGMRHQDIYPAYPKGGFTWRTAPDTFFETVQNVPWNKMVRRELLNRHGIRFQNLHLTEDLMYSLPAAVVAASIVRLPKPLMVHREFSGINAMADKGRYPLDFLDAFAELRRWLQKKDIYTPLRQSYQTWLLDAVYYNMLTYQNFEGFVAAYDRLTACGLLAYDLLDIDPAQVHDRRYRGVLEALHTGSRERFLLACANIKDAEVQEQKCGFQDVQSSLKWLFRCLKKRVIRGAKA